LNLILSAIDDDGALALFADDAKRMWADLPGVHGQKRDARAFSSLWEERTGAVASVFTAQRIYRLHRVDPPRPVDGRMRVALPADVPLVAGWLDAFGVEALRNTPDPDGARASAVRFIAGIGRRTLYLWDDGRPVSMTLAAAVTPNGSRIGAVYTPPEVRGRGYASTLVAAASQSQLDAGRRFCFLFTDLANPTSNKIYQAIGYEPVCDVDEYRFAAPTADDQS
jgi:predicted GNAT family acetyltransferase